MLTALPIVAFWLETIVVWSLIAISVVRIERSRREYLFNLAYQRYFHENVPSGWIFHDGIGA